jgi:type II secretory pathway pseudopilin PulG
MAELVEAAVRSGERELAGLALERLAETTSAARTDWALGIEARSRALLSDGDSADTLYREAIERLARTSIRLQLAGAHLLYGKWLRRERRRREARQQLRTALEMFTNMGTKGFARWPLPLADEVVAQRRRTGNWLSSGNKGRSGRWATGAANGDPGAHMPSRSPSAVRGGLAGCASPTTASVLATSSGTTSHHSRGGVSRNRHISSLSRAGPSGADRRSIRPRGREAAPSSDRHPPTRSSPPNWTSMSGVGFKPSPARPGPHRRQWFARGCGAVPRCAGRTATL